MCYDAVLVYVNICQSCASAASGVLVRSWSLSRVKYLSVGRCTKVYKSYFPNDTADLSDLTMFNSQRNSWFNQKSHRETFGRPFPTVSFSCRLALNIKQLVECGWSQWWVHHHKASWFKFLCDINIYIKLHKHAMKRFTGAFIHERWKHSVNEMPFGQRFS